MLQTHWTNAEGERYLLASSEHIASITEMLIDPEVGRWLWFTPAPEAVFDGFFRPLIDAQTKELGAGRWPTTAVFVVEDAATGTYLGQGAVVGVEGSPGGYEIGFQLPSSSWGRGVGSRLARFLCAYSVCCCAAVRIQGTCLEGNAASRAILSGLGLTIEGSRPGYRLREGERHTELSYGALVASLDADSFRAYGASLGLG